MNQIESAEPIRLNEEAVKSLTETRKWTTFFGILGIVAISIIILSALIMIFILPFLNESTDLGNTPVFLGLIYMITIGIYILPVLYLMRFGRLMKNALTKSDDQLMGMALKNLTLHFRTVGIITIVMISLYILIILAMIVFGMGMYGGKLIGA